MIYVILCVMAAIILFLSAKLYLIKKAAREITNDLSKKIKSDTCTQLRISSRDKDIRRLASCINEQLDEFENTEIKGTTNDYLNDYVSDKILNTNKTFEETTTNVIGVDWS